jgi:thiamine biosynthesis lipoprotein
VQALEFRAMNTAVVLAVAGQVGAEPALEAARRFVDDCERRFSRFQPESEVSQLNRSAGEWRAVSAELIDLLVKSMAFHRETDGLFDPSILPALKRAGYDRSMDEIHRYGASQPALTLLERGRLQQIEIDAESGWVRLPAGMEIDLGGIAKGWIVEKAAEQLARSAGACAVSAGGDILFRGLPSEGALWQVRIEDPWNPAQEVARLEVGPGAIATSSVVKRSWIQGGVRRHHLIDPRTGEPARGDWASVTVLAPEIMTAEVYAKALLLGGEVRLGWLLSQRPEISYIVVKSDGSVISSFEHVEYSNERKSNVLQ